MEAYLPFYLLLPTQSCFNSLQRRPRLFADHTEVGGQLSKNKLFAWQPLTDDEMSELWGAKRGAAGQTQSDSDAHASKLRFSLPA